MDEAKSGMCSLKDFTNFPNLVELKVDVKMQIRVHGIKLRIKKSIIIMVS